MAGQIALAIIRGCVWLWSSAEAIDSRLWQAWLGAYRHFAKFVAGVIDSIFALLSGFGRWMITRAGLTYCSVIGFVAVLVSLWALDEIRAAEMTRRTYLEALQQNAHNNRAPVDEVDPVLARVGGSYIKLSDLQDRVVAQGTLTAAQSFDPASELAEQLLSEAIDEALMAAAAGQDRLGQDELIEERVEAARKRILAAAWLKRQVDANVTDETVRDLFEAQSDLASLGKQIRVRHILVASREEAAEILDELNTGGDFARIARQKSLDRGTAPFGGDTGYITRAMVPNDFARIVFAFEEGQTSPPFRTSEGWNIVRIVEKRNANQIAFEDVEDNLREFLTLRTINDTLADLREQADIEIYAQRPRINSDTDDQPAEPPSKDTATP